VLDGQKEGFCGLKPCPGGHDAHTMIAGFGKDADAILMTKKEVLAATTFGRRIAEEEADDLVGYFVETEQWRRVVSGEVDIVYGPKGSGKSALYSLLRKKRDELMSKGIVPAAGEKVRGTPVFEDLVADPPASEDQFRGLWKLYFLSLAGMAFRVLKTDNEHASKVVEVLHEAGLLPTEWSLKAMLKGALDYARRIDSFSTDVKVNPHTGMPEGFGGKITLREPGAEQRNHGVLSVDQLLEIADRALTKSGHRLWIVLDRLDVAFADSAELEGNALRALFRVYRDMADLSHFGLKIFLRDDIWNRITSQGFREASHITRSITITWNSQALLHLVVRRAIHNEAIRMFYDVNPAVVLSSAEEQEKLFYRMFPTQVDAGPQKPTTFNWMLSRTADGTRQTAPRELIHLLTAARDQQMKLLEMGAAEPTGETLIDRAALKGALPEVSKVRFEQTLCAEHPTIKPILLRLEGEKTQQTPITLAKIWNVSDETALERAEKLVEIGFFEKRGSKEQPIFWVPFLYRDALTLVQGPAD